MSGAVAAHIGLGSNLAEPRQQVARALHWLRELPQSRLLAHSSLYLTEPWGVENQAPFVNAVARLQTRLEPRILLRKLLEFEERAGRRRRLRWGPRVLDLDLLTLGTQRMQEQDLTLPHPHIHQRAFVLAPLAEISPELDVPGQGRVGDLLAAVDTSGVVRLS